MRNDPPDPASASPQWTLVRGARQLITLRGATGPRRGTAMNELNIITDGAVLIRDGVIAEVGPTRRLQNLEKARKATQIDAAGRIIMPAFVDPDAVLIKPTLSERKHHLAVLSRRIVESAAQVVAGEWARLGVLTIGAHTGHATNLRDAVKILLVHRALQGRPLRIRSFFSAHSATRSELDEKWLPTIRRRSLASIIEFGTHVANGGPDEAERVRGLILAAEDHGLAIRMRGSHDSDPRVYTLARQAGIVAWVGVPPSADIPAPRDFGGVYVLPASESLQFGCGQAPNVRSAINDGIPIAIGSSCPAEGPRSSNPQFLLYLGIARFGLSHEEAIMACTYNAACSLKLSHVTGSLEPGKSADLIVMDVHDYHELAHHVGHNDVLLAMRAGRTVYRRTPINGVEQGTPPPRLS